MSGPRDNARRRPRGVQAVDWRVSASCYSTSQMYRLCIVGLFALLAQGCATRPEPKAVSLASFFDVDYQTWTCQQLADEANLLSDALAVATEHEPNAHATERVALIKRASQAVRAASTLKRCKT